MDTGWTSLCLPVKDLGRSRSFYQTLGMELLEEIENQRAILRNGPFRIALMPFLREPLLNWRGGDVFAAHAAFARLLPDTPGTPRRYRADEPEQGADADGACWATRDPDGFEILLDTNELETGEAGRAARIARILSDTRQALERAGASEACLEALRVEVIDRFSSNDGRRT